MRAARSPTGSGLAAGRCGSQLNSASIDSHSHSEFSDNTRITLRSKRKHSEDDGNITEKLGEIRKQLSQMMEMMTSLNRNQK